MDRRLCQNQAYQADDDDDNGPLVGGQVAAGSVPDITRQRRSRPPDKCPEKPDEKQAPNLRKYFGAISLSGN
jgi:hypothetical protein